MRVVSLNCTRNRHDNKGPVIRPAQSVTQCSVPTPQVNFGAHAYMKSNAVVDGTKDWETA